jgi:hypothetical protein
MLALDRHGKAFEDFPRPAKVFAPKRANISAPILNLF